MSIAESIKYYRKLKGLSRLQVSDMVGIKSRTYAAYEEGRAEPSLTTLTKLKHLFGVKSVEDFLSDQPIIDNCDWLKDCYQKLNKRDKAIVDAVMGIGQ